MVKLTTEEQKRLNAVNTEKTNAINESNNTYNQLMKDEATRRDSLNNLANQYESQQNAILDRQLESYQKTIDQQKADAEKQAFNERVKALNSYTEYTNPYGYQSEVMGNAGLSNSGVGQIAQQSAYVTYQNRVASANTALQDAITKYDKEMDDAILNRDVTKAQNALTKLQTQMNNLDNYYNNISTLSQNQLTAKQNLNNAYTNNYNNVYNQIMNEKQFDESVRQFNEQMKLSKSNSTSGGKTPVVKKKTEEEEIKDKTGASQESLNKVISALQMAVKVNAGVGNNKLNISVLKNYANKFNLTDDQISYVAKKLGISMK